MPQISYDDLISSTEYIFLFRGKSVFNHFSNSTKFEEYSMNT